MRNALLAAACFAALTVRPAFAQSGPGLPTFDFAGATNALAQIEKLKSQLETMKSSLTMSQNLWSVAQHGNSALSVAPGLSSLTSQMPGSSAAWAPSMTMGTQLVGRASQFYGQNHVYTPTGDDFGAQEIERRQRATANMQGEIQTGLEASDARISQLGEMQADIESGNNNDAVSLAAVQAHIQSEQNFLANEQTKIARLQLAQATQASVDQQRAEQNARREAEDMHTTAAAAAGWPTTGQGSVAANMDPADQPYMDRATAQFLGGPVSSSAPVSSVITPGDQAYMDAAAAKLLGGPVVHVAQ